MCVLVYRVPFIIIIAVKTNEPRSVRAGRDDGSVSSRIRDGTGRDGGNIVRNDFASESLT